MDRREAGAPPDIDDLGGRRRWALLAAAGVTALTLAPPLAAVGGRLLSVHMALQMVLLFLSAPLLAYATIPRLNGRARVLAHPVVGLVAFNIVLFAWQAPAALDATASNGALNLAAHLSFLFGATCFWWPVVRSGVLSRIAKVGYLLVAGVPPTIPGLVLAFSHRVLYAGYATGPRPLGLTPLADQQLAGLLLFGSAKAVLVTSTFVLVWRMLAPESEPPDDDRYDSKVPASPPSGPAWLSRLDDELPPEPVRERRRVLALK